MNSSFFLHSSHLTKRHIPIMQALHMIKGNGESSYAKNSLFQRKLMSFGSFMVEHAIVNILLEVQPKSIGVADLGCSSGPNSLAAVSHIIHMVDAASHKMGPPVPEIRVSLNDLPGNDFNNVFESLPELYKKLKKEYCIEGCYICGVPGSFYGRLFPEQSLHFVHSSSSLHWLSQAPSGLDEKIYISKGSSASIIEEYQHQFHEDFSLFLTSRAKEIVVRGRMVLTFIVRRSPDPCVDEGSYFFEPLAHALASMASDGLVEKERVDSFNLPYYPPSFEEVECEVKKEGSFQIVRAEPFDIEWFVDEFSSLKDSRSNQAAKTIRALVEPILDSHFYLGPKMMDELFRRHVKIFQECFSEVTFKTTTWVISLIKKG